MNASDIRKFVERHGGGHLGSRVFIDKVLNPALEGKKLSDGTDLKTRPEDFSLRALWEGLVGEIRGSSLQDTIIKFHGREMPLHEAGAAGLHSTMFPTATSNIIHRAVIEGYENEQFIGDMLVTDMPSTLKEERVSGS